MNLQVKNVPPELHERLRRHARAHNCSMGEVVLVAVERELARREWQERFAERPSADLGIAAASLLEKARRHRDEELE